MILSYRYYRYFLFPSQTRKWRFTGGKPGVQGGQVHIRTLRSVRISITWLLLIPTPLLPGLFCRRTISWRSSNKGGCFLKGHYGQFLRQKGQKSKFCRTTWAVQLRSQESRPLPPALISCFFVVSTTNLYIFSKSGGLGCYRTKHFQCLNTPLICVLLMSLLFIFW